MAVPSIPNAASALQAAVGGITGSLAQLASDSNAVSDSQAAKDPWWKYTGEDSGLPGSRYPIDVLRWNKLYPYQLLVVEYMGEGFYRQMPEWQFTLPIPPDSLSVSMPFASEVKATLEGIVEEHGGAPFRLISFSGTTGVQPLRESGLQGAMVDVSAITRTLLNIPGGTVNAIASTVQTALRFIPTPNIMSPVLTGTDILGTIGRGSGYYQFRLMKLFMERYATIKQTAEGKNLRLALAIWKDQEVFLVTPTSFDLTRSVSSGPLSYNYRFSAKAWRRISLTSPAPITPLPITGGGLTGLPLILESISAARDTLVRLRDVVQAVRSDIDLALLEPCRELVLLAKDAAGTAITLADLPNQLIKDAQGAVKAGEVELLRAQGLANGLLTPKQAGITATSATGRQQTLESTRSDSTADPLNKVFDNPLASFSIFSQLQTRRLRLAPQTQTKLADELRRVRSFRRGDFVSKQEAIKEVMNDFADAIGQGSAVFDEIMGRVGREAVREATDEDFEALWAMNNVVMALDRILLKDEASSAKLNALEYVAGLARASGVAFTQPTAKLAVPFPYGGSLERLALQYLGSANRWHEIATLNGLRSPFVDEVGFTLPLLTNGSGNTLTISDASNLYTGQMITISSNDKPRVKRRLLSIQKISSGFYQLTVDGDATMGDYSINAGANIHSYLPDTVNSNQQIFIPSTDTVDAELINRDVPGVNSFQTLLDRGGVDMALTNEGDLIVTPDGDTPWAVGMANIIQRIRIMYSTARGSLLQHPNIGLLVPPGMSTADLDPAQLLEASRNMFAQDSDFSGVFYASVTKNGPIAKHVVHVGVAGVEQLLPVGLDIVR